MFRENMNVMKIPMSSKTAVDLQEDICENIYIYQEFSAYWYNVMEKCSTTIQKHMYLREKCPSKVRRALSYKWIIIKWM